MRPRVSLRARRRAGRIALGSALALATLTCAAEPPTDPGGSPAASPTLAASASGDLVPGRVLVRFRPGANATAIADAHGATLGPRVALGIRLLGVGVGSERAIAAALARNPGVEFAEPDRLRTFDDPGCAGCVLPADALFGYKWDLHNDGTINSASGDELATTGAVDADVDWLEAFDRLGGSFAGAARVAILDTGVRQTHEDLAGKIVAQRDFVNDDADATDDQGHGTHVAGIAAARGDNGVGLAGVAYGANVGLMAAKVCTPTFFGLSAECPSSAIVAAIEWAVDNGANVINVSLGGAEGSESERVALAYARDHDVLPFCAAGNDGVEGVLYPAAFPECVAVAATNWSDGAASYSNRGPEVELAAPGGDFENSSGYSQIASTCYGHDGNYCLKAGTSMATPQAAGLAALLYALGLTTDDEVLGRMTSTSDDLGEAGRDATFGHGRINVFRAIDGLDGGGGGPTNDPPVADFTHACDGLSCSFTDASVDSDGTITAWSWTFGDGASSTVQSPTHTYACAGTYTVTLQVTDDAGATDSVSRSIDVSAPPAATGDPASIPGLAVWLRADRLVDLADGDPVATWTDESGSCNHATQPSAAKRPVFRTGRANGRPAVVFDATDDGMATPLDPGVDVTIFTVYASRAAATGKTMNGGFSFFLGPYVGAYRNYTGGYATGPAVEAGRWLVHTMRQTSAVDELFVDGLFAASTDATADPGVLRLADEGTYGQELDGEIAEILVYDRALTDGELASVHDWLLGRYVPPPDVNAAPAASFTESCADLECAFTDTSTDSDGSIVGWSWDFGDGAGSTEQNPTHVYASAGAYTVTLQVTDDGGAVDATSREVTVTEPSSGGGEFVDPSSVEGLALWLAADGLTGLADGDPVATWPDASGTGHDATQSDAARRPIYRTADGRPAVFFDGTDDGLATALDPGKAVTVLAVYASRAGATGKVVTGGHRFFLGPYVGAYRNYTGSYVNGPAVAAGRWLIHVLRQDGTAELFIDGTAWGSTTKTANPSRVLLAGEGRYGDALDGDVAEILVYDRTLTDAELADVTAWLAAKHGIP